MERPSRLTTGLVLVGLSALGLALHDGLSLLAAIRRVVTRADPAWLGFVVAVLLASGVFAVRRSWRRATTRSVDPDSGSGHARPVSGSMSTTAHVPVVLSVAALVTILVGVHTDSVHVKPMYDYTVATGWDGPLNYQEREMIELAAIGVVGTLGALRWRRVAAGVIVVGALVLVYPVRFFTRGLAGVTEEMVAFGGESVELYYGAEPYLLLLGGLLLVLAGVVGVRGAVPGVQRIGAALESVRSA